MSAQTVAATLRHATGREVQVLDRLPCVLDGPYREQPACLKPEQTGLPWLAGPHAYRHGAAADQRGVRPGGSLHTHGWQTFPLDRTFLPIAS